MASQTSWTTYHATYDGRNSRDVISLMQHGESDGSAPPYLRDVVAAAEIPGADLAGAEAWLVGRGVPEAHARRMVEEVAACRAGDRAEKVHAAYDPDWPLVGVDPEADAADRAQADLSGHFGRYSEAGSVHFRWFATSGDARRWSEENSRAWPEGDWMGRSDAGGPISAVDAFDVLTPWGTRAYFGPAEDRPGSVRIPSGIVPRESGDQS